MPYITPVAHRIAALFSKKEYLAFRSGLQSVEYHQQRVLADILKTVQGTESADKYGLTGFESMEQFRRKVPVTEYPDWVNLIKRQRSCGGPIISNSPCERYQPTSGSMSEVKWIPYTKQFLGQIDAYISPLIYRMYKTYPEIRQGSHYWSLSWVPSKLRKKISPNINDDLKLLPFWKRGFMGLIMAVPDEVAHAPTSDDSMLATVCYLCADHQLSLISVWSPTFLLSMLDFIQIHRNDIARILETGNWGEFDKALNYLRCPKSSRAAAILNLWDGTISPRILRQLWPNLGVISAWDTWTSSDWADEVKKLFPDVAFEGKGLLATEGVVTIPFGERYPLAYRCHFFEFLDINTHKISYAWELKKGQHVQPILTTGTGMLRYKLNDKLEVSGFMGSCPCFIFKGRLGDVDLVGEKLSTEIAQNVLEIIKKDYPIKPVSLLAVPQKYSGLKSRYVLLCEGWGENIAKMAAERVEKELRKNYHYDLARNLNQLSHAVCIVSPRANVIYQYRAIAVNMVAGNLKTEPITLWNCELPPALKNRLIQFRKPKKLLHHRSGGMKIRAIKSSS